MPTEEVSKESSDFWISSNHRNVIWLVPSDTFLTGFQVFERNLKEWILEKRAEGYVIVGVEQSPDSITLEEFTFPKKTLLLLGKGDFSFLTSIYVHQSMCINLCASIYVHQSLTRIFVIVWTGLFFGCV
jgi:hypothetical protein